MAELISYSSRIYLRSRYHIEDKMRPAGVFQHYIGDNEWLMLVLLKAAMVV